MKNIYLIHFEYFVNNNEEENVILPIYKEKWKKFEEGEDIYNEFITEGCSCSQVIFRIQLNKKDNTILLTYSISKNNNIVKEVNNAIVKKYEMLRY